MLKVNRDYLRNKYDFDPVSDSFFYREMASKGEAWNRENAGKEVKPIYSNGKRYMFCLDALYSYDQLITIYEIGDYIVPKGFEAKDLVKAELKVKETISKLPLKKLKQITKDLQEGKSVISVIDKAKGKNKRSKVLVKEDVAINPLTGFPAHIYFNDVRGFYVKVKYRTKMHCRTHLKDMEEALRVRNDLYDELNLADLKGEDMANYVSSSNRK